MCRGSMTSSILDSFSGINVMLGDLWGGSSDRDGGGGMWQNALI